MVDVNSPVSPLDRKPGYHSPLRAEQAARSRAAVLAAARELFVTQGYAGTTLEQVAELAGVSKPTVFNAIGNKVTLFRAVRDVAMAGDDNPATVTQRSSVTAIEEAADLEGAVQAVADHVGALCERYYPIHHALTRADTPLAELYAEAEGQRLVGAGHLLERLTRHAPTRVSTDEAVDRLWLLMSPDNYGKLVVARGWSLARYRTWVAESVRAQLF